LPLRTLEGIASTNAGMIDRVDGDLGLERKNAASQASKRIDGGTSRTAVDQPELRRGFFD